MKYIQWCLELFLFLWVFLGETPVLLELRKKLLLPRKPQENRERCGFMSLQLPCINHCTDTPSRIREFWLCLKHSPELSALKMRSLCWFLFHCLLLRHKMLFLGVFLKGAQPVSQLLVWQITEAKILEGYSRWQTYWNFCRHWVPLLLMGSSKWDWSISLVLFRGRWCVSGTKFFISSCRQWKRSRMGYFPSDTLSNAILDGEFACCAQDPRMLLQLSINHMLPAPQQACWSPVPWLPPTQKSSFTEAQQLCGKYIPFNNWLSLTWKIESTAEDSFPERLFWFFFSNWN